MAAAGAGKLKCLHPRLRMLAAALLSMGVSGSLRIYQSYEVNETLSKARTQHEVYFLVLFKMPYNIEGTSHAFTRVINAIPIEMDPVLGIVIDPAISSNELLYANRDGQQARVHFHYQYMMNEWGATHKTDEVRSRLESIVDDANDFRIAEKRSFARMSQSDRFLHRLKHQHSVRGAKKNLTDSVRELFAIKNQEKANVTRFALDLQKSIDDVLPPLGRDPLPAFADIDPTASQHEDEHSNTAIKEIKRSVGHEQFDEDIADNDDIIGFERGNWRKLARAAQKEREKGRKVKRAKKKDTGIIGFISSIQKSGKKAKRDERRRGQSRREEPEGERRRGRRRGDAKSG